MLGSLAEELAGSCSAAFAICCPAFLSASAASCWFCGCPDSGLPDGDCGAELCCGADDGLEGDEDGDEGDEEGVDGEDDGCDEGDCDGVLGADGGGDEEGGVELGGMLGGEDDCCCVSQADSRRPMMPTEINWLIRRINIPGCLPRLSRGFAEV